MYLQKSRHVACSGICLATTPKLDKKQKVSVFHMIQYQAKTNQLIVPIKVDRKQLPCSILEL